MRKLSVLLATLLGSSVVMAEEVVISTGKRGGSYFSTGESLAKVLKEYDYQTSVKKSRGSVENIERVSNGEAAVGFTQLDALAWWMGRNPEKAKDLMEVGQLFPECVYVAVNGDGPIGDEDDLQSDKGKIAVQKKGSGSAVTWSYMQALEPGYKKSQTFYQGGMQVLSQIASNPDGEINAFLWVSNPLNLDQRYLKTVLGNDKLELLDLDDKDLNDKFKPLKKAIYEFQKPDVKKGFLNDQEVKTICTQAVAVTRKDLDEDLLDDLADIMLNQHNRVVPSEKE